VKRLTKQLAQVKEAMRELPCFEGSWTKALLKMGSSLEGYLKAKCCSYEESLTITIDKLRGVFQYWFRCYRDEKALQGKSRFKTWRWLNSYMDVRLYQDLLFQEEFLEDKLYFHLRGTHYYSREDQGSRKRRAKRGQGSK